MTYRRAKKSIGTGLFLEPLSMHVNFVSLGWVNGYCTLVCLSLHNLDSARALGGGLDEHVHRVGDN